MEENKRGGKRLGAGRKPVLNKKKLIPLYVEQNKILPFGGEDKMKGELYDFIDGKASIQDLTKPTNEIKPFEQPKTNYEIKIDPKPESLPLGNFEALKAKIMATETVEEIQEVMKEVKTALLNGKQKQALDAIAKEHSKQFYTD